MKTVCLCVTLLISVLATCRCQNSPLNIIPGTNARGFPSIPNILGQPSIAGRPNTFSSVLNLIQANRKPGTIQNPSMGGNLQMGFQNQNIVQASGQSQPQELNRNNAPSGATNPLMSRPPPSAGQFPVNQQAPRPDSSASNRELGLQIQQSSGRSAVDQNLLNQQNPRPIVNQMPQNQDFSQNKDFNLPSAPYQENSPSMYQQNPAIDSSSPYDSEYQPPQYANQLPGPNQPYPLDYTAPDTSASNVYGASGGASYTQQGYATTVSSSGYTTSPQYAFQSYNQPSPGPVYSNPGPSYSNPAPSYATPSYANPAPSYVNSAASYPTPSSSYSNPAPSYASAAPNYGNPAPTYTNSAPSYVNPAPSYASPVAGYESATPSYANPAPSYVNPAPSYASPVAGYESATPSYANPAPSYVNPAPSYASPVAGYESTTASYANPAPSYGTPSYASPVAGYESATPSYANPAPSYSNAAPSYPSPSGYSGGTGYQNAYGPPKDNWQVQYNNGDQDVIVRDAGCCGLSGLFSGLISFGDFLTSGAEWARPLTVPAFLGFLLAGNVVFRP